MRALSAADYYARQFYRPPNWRYTRAQAILNREVPRVRVADEDPLVLDTVAYLKAERRLRDSNYSEFDRGRRLMARWPELFGAYELQTRGGISLPRTSLEAHILAKVDNNKVAQRLATEPAVIDLYRKLFYDVSDRLESVEYIAGFVIGPVFQAGLESLNVELLAKYFAYFGGEVMLDTVLFGMTRVSNIKTDGEVLGYLEQTVNRALKQQTATMAILMQPGRFDIRTLIEGYVAIVQLERSIQDGQEEQTWVSGLADILRQMFPIPLTLEQRQEHRTLIGSPSGVLPVEPRLQERLALASGELSVAEVDSRLSTFTLPLPGTGFQNAGDKPR